jgi:ribosomal-protein-alanine N-acetyltransferase
MSGKAHGLAGERIALRPWRNSDRDAFAAMNADAEVMRHFPSTLTREQSDAMFERLRTAMGERGWGLWCVDAGGECAGFCGLAVPRFVPPFRFEGAQCVEIGWRLRREFWGQGYASEAARLALRYGFDVLKLAEIVSFTSRSNERSQAVMRRIGMTHDAQSDFMHPNIAADDPLAAHVLYRIASADWMKQQSA